MSKWERRLTKDGFAVSRGRDRRLIYVEDVEKSFPAYAHGLVSPLYDMAPSGSNISEEERNVRTRAALKVVVSRHGRPEVETRLRDAAVSPDAEPARVRLLSILAGLPA